MTSSDPTPDTRLMPPQERITRLDLILKSIRSANQVLAKETDRERLIRGVSDNLVKNRGYLSALIVLFGEKNKISLIADSRIDETPLTSILKDQIMKGNLPHCVAIATENHDVVIIDDVYSECGACLLKEKFENRKVMSISLEYGDRSYGVLCVSVPSQTIVDEIEQNLFHTVGNAIALALRYIEVDEIRKKAEDSLSRQNASELTVRNRVTEVFLRYPDEEMYGNVLGILLEVTGSKYGVFGYLDENGDLVVPTMARMAWDKNQPADRKTVFPREKWGDSDWLSAIREKRTIVMNEPSTETPESHVRITRHVSMPLIDKDGVVGLIQVTNKDTDYTEKDIELLEIIGRAIAPVLAARINKERKEDELARTNISLLEEKQRAEAYFDFLAHDIMNILSPVMAYADMMNSKPNDPAQISKFTSKILEQVKRASSMISNLRRLESIEKTHPNEIDTIDVRSLLSAMEDTIRSDFPNKKIEISYDIPNVESMIVRGGEWVENILRSVYDNAVRYSTGQAVKLEIKASLLEQEGMGAFWQIEISDNGPGIVDNVKSHLGDNIAVKERQFKGVASSLPFCVSMMKVLGGDLLIQDRIPGDHKQGTKVTIKIPKGE
jgi:K+-sensing histidine kinase KdpD